MSPAACWRARRISRAVSAMVSLTGPMRGGHGCPGRAGTGASPRGMPRSAPLTFFFFFSSSFSSPAGGGGGRVISPHSALRMATWRSWARAARAVCRQNAVPGAHLGLVPAEHVLSGFERFLAGPAPPGDRHEERHRGRLVFRSPAQVKRQVVRPGEQAADQQDVPRAGGGGQGPVRVPGSLGPVPARAPLKDRVPDGAFGLDHRAGRQGDTEIPGDDRDVGQARGLARPAQGAAAAIDFVKGRHRAGRPAVSRRSSWPMASCGLAARSSLPGMPAARRRARSFSTARA